MLRGHKVVLLNSKLGAMRSQSRTSEIKNGGDTKSQSRTSKIQTGGAPRS